MEKPTEKEPYTNIRWMIRRDMPAVMDIEQQSFEFPWSEEEFIRCQRQRNCICMVAERNDHVAGFMIYELHKNRLHLLNFAVGPEARRSGVGTAMMTKLASKLTEERRSRIMLEMRETNLPAQIFMQSLGLKAISVLRDFYEDTHEDAYLMQYRCNPNAVNRVVNAVERITGQKWCKKYDTQVNQTIETKECIKNPEAVIEELCKKTGLKPSQFVNVSQLENEVNRMRHAITIPHHRRDAFEILLTVMRKLLVTHSLDFSRSEKLYEDILKKYGHSEGSLASFLGEAKQAYQKECTELAKLKEGINVSELIESYPLKDYTPEGPTTTDHGKIQLKLDLRKIQKILESQRSQGHAANLQPRNGIREI